MQHVVNAIGEMTSMMLENIAALKLKHPGNEACLFVDDSRGLTSEVGSCIALMLILLCCVAVVSGVFYRLYTSIYYLLFPLFHLLPGYSCNT